MVERFPFDSLPPLAGVSEPVSRSHPRLLLEVTRGKTRHPLRPVIPPRFLIGSSPACDLQLGGNGIPSLHSVIVWDNPFFRWERLAAAPALYRNGSETDSAVLQDGDTIHCGDFEFIARLIPVEELTVAPAGRGEQALTGTREGAEPATERQEAFSGQHVREMSAAELVRLLEQECQEVSRIEEGRRLGARALLQSALRRAAEESRENQPALPDDQQMLLQLQQLLQQLDACVRAVDQTPLVSSGSVRPALIETWNRVVEAERSLTRRLTHLLKDLRTIDFPDDDQTSRSAA